ncbi:MAG TPA: CHAT domain-containing protein, partial [Vicinamibacteria bacterium]
DGVLGFTRAFLYAGSSSVLATLWDLPDASAQHVLPRFYREWRRGSDKSAALRDAQRALIAALRAGRIRVRTPLGEAVLPEDPVLWANFVLVGEP